MKKRTRGLTDVELAFLAQYHKSGSINATAAYMTVAPRVTSKDSASSRASQVLCKPAAQAELERLRGKVEEKAIITRAEILQELRNIGMSNIDDFTELDEQGRIRVVNFGKEAALDRKNLAAISSFEVEERTIKARKDSGEEDEVIRRTKFKLWDKKEALVAAGKEIGMFVERSQQLGADGQPVNPMSAVPATLIVKFVDPKAAKKK